eukprot:symbB.v1.2.031132.t1/scaffold3581.1/size55290/1
MTTTSAEIAHLSEDPPVTAPQEQTTTPATIAQATLVPTVDNMNMEHISFSIKHLEARITQLEQNNMEPEETGSTASQLQDLGFMTRAEHEQEIRRLWNAIHTLQLAHQSYITNAYVLQAVAASNNMPCVLTVWENRKMASAKLTQVVGDYMISMVGSNVTEHLTERLRVLETENAQLRASQINPTQQDAADSQPEAEIGSEAPPADESGTRTPCRTTSSQMNLRSPLQPGLHKPPAPTKLPTFTPTPPTKPLPNTQRQLQFGTTPQTPAKQVENMRVGSSFKVLECEGPNNHQIQSINAWMKTKIHDVAIHGKLDELAKKLEEQLNQLPLGQQPSINRYLVEWGMEPTRASKYKPREAIKLLCILHEIRQ